MGILPVETYSSYSKSSVSEQEKEENQGVRVTSKMAVKMLCLCAVPATELKCSAFYKHSL